MPKLFLRRRIRIQLSVRRSSTRDDDSDGGENGVEEIGAIISSIAHERRWRIGHLLQQWPDMGGVVNLFYHQVKSNDFIIVPI